MNKRALVTGADGFLGSHLTELLLAQGYKVKAIAFYNSFNNLGWLEDIAQNERLQIISGDIRDPVFCKSIIQEVDVIFHLAALIAIPYSYYAPYSYTDTNITGTLNILQAARESGNIRVLHTSTSEVYGTAQYVPINEEHPKQPQSPYSATKIGADALALSFYNSFDLPVTIVRPFNTYGPRQSARAIIPTMITQIASGIKEIKLGDLTPTRDFNFVYDICNGFIAIEQSENTIGQEINIATGNEMSIMETLNMTMSIMGKKIDVVADNERIRPQNSEVFRLVGDNSLIKELTDWEPKYTFRDGLKETISWFNRPENLLKYKAKVYNI